MRLAAHRWLKRRAAAKAKIGLQAPVCESVERWAADRQGAQSRTLFPPRQIERALPRTIEPEIHAEYLDRRIANQRGRYLVPVHGARLLGKNGLVVLPDGSFAAEAVYGRPQVENDSAYYAPRRRPVVARSGNYFSLIVNWASDGNYYHWFHDTLARLYGVLPFLPEDTIFIVPAKLKPFQSQTLRLVGLEEHQLAYFSGEEAWELETLHFAPATTNSGSDRREADEWLRDRILGGFGITPVAAGRRIFLSRRLAPTRRLANEDAVEDYLRRYGFETCIAETLPLRGQVELFSQAEMVVATHGAGLTNTLFSPRGLIIVDMIQPSMLSWAYVFWTMSEELGHRYWYFTAGSVTRAGHRDDTYVPLEKLVATFERLEIKPNA